MDIVNLTALEVQVVSETGAVLLALPPSGTVATVREEILPGIYRRSCELHREIQGAPVVRRCWGATDGLPSESRQRCYVVPITVALACPDRHDLLVPHDPRVGVHELQPAITCRALAQIDQGIPW